VRFLVDENLSPRICPILADSGHHAAHVRDEGMAGATDPQVLAAAAAGGHILITADRGDFGRELALTRALAPSVILLPSYRTSYAQATSRLYSLPTSPTW
jgi:predicted nuclease of predicted toxin-antitoxin system